MRIRSMTCALALLAVLALFGAAMGGGSDWAMRSLRLIVHNQTYSAFLISMRTGGNEQVLGQAPPEFSNTLFIPDPLPDGSVRFVARLAGEDHVAHTSKTVRLTPGATLQWHLPANTLSVSTPKAN